MSQSERQSFATDELALVLSRYNPGVIESIKPFERGSRRSPKVVIMTEKGRFLLKRRAAERRSQRRIELAHAVQRRLVETGYPFARPIPTREGETWLRLGMETYEMFEYVRGSHYESTIAQTESAGRSLGAFHQSLSRLPVNEDAPVGSFHDMNEVRTALNSIPSTVSSHDSVMGMEAELLGLTSRLFDAYDEAAEHADSNGFASLPLQVVHGDWHPGNLLFDGDRVRAVVDFDSCRICQRICDVANGALQFSLVVGDTPEDWPDHLDAKRFKAFLDGYRSESPMTDAEWSCLVPLMIEALIGETVFPIARTGSFGRFTGFGFMRVVDRKAQWLREQSDHLRRAARTT